MRHKFETFLEVSVIYKLNSVLGFYGYHGWLKTVFENYEDNYNQDMSLQCGFTKCRLRMTTPKTQINGSKFSMIILQPSGIWSGRLWIFSGSTCNKLKHLFAIYVIAFITCCGLRVVQIWNQMEQTYGPRTTPIDIVDIRSKLRCSTHMYLRSNPMYLLLDNKPEIGYGTCIQI